MRVLTREDTEKACRLAGKKVNSIFHDMERLELMFKMYRCGMSLSSIARHFEVDHTTVLYHVKKYKVVKNTTSRDERYLVHDLYAPVLSVRDQTKVLGVKHNSSLPFYHKVPMEHKDVDGSELNKGKSYAGYLKEMAQKGKGLLARARRLGIQ